MIRLLWFFRKIRRLRSVRPAIFIISQVPPSIKCKAVWWVLSGTAAVLDLVLFVRRVWKVFLDWRVNHVEQWTRPRAVFWQQSKRSTWRIFPVTIKPILILNHPIRRNTMISSSQTCSSCRPRVYTVYSCHRSFGRSSVASFALFWSKSSSTVWNEKWHRRFSWPFSLVCIESAPDRSMRVSFSWHVSRPSWSSWVSSVSPSLIAIQSNERHSTTGETRSVIRN